METRQPLTSIVRVDRPSRSSDRIFSRKDWLNLARLLTAAWWLSLQRYYDERSEE